MNAKPLWQDVFRLWVICFATSLVIYAPLLADPLVRHDDFPALLGHKHMAYQKALDEGRWLNYWWQLRPIFWPSQVSFVLYILAWSIFSASSSVIMLGRDAPVWFKGFFALFVALSIPAFKIVLWFNTLLPGVWVITIFALLVVFLPHRTSLALLFVGVPLSFMAYTTYPFLLMTLVVMSRKAPQTYKSLMITLAVFFASLAVALLSVYSLNYFYHGVFGIPIAEWRTPTEVKTIEDLIANLGKLKLYLQGTVKQFGGGVDRNGGILLLFVAIAWGILFRQQPFVAVSILAAVLAGLAPLLAKSVMSGVLVPVRAFGWIWLLFGLTFTVATLNLSKTPGRVASIARIAILCILLVKLTLFIKLTYVVMPPWQQTTRGIVADVPEGTETIHVYGHYLGLNGAVRAGIQHSRGLRLRLTYLTGAEVFICQETPKSCEDVDPPFHPRTWTHVPIVETVGKHTFVLLPPPPIGP